MMKHYLLALFVLGTFAACNQKDTEHDAEGILLAESMQTLSGGGFSFSPMSHEDSASVLNYKPEVYLHNGKPYTGKITSYDEKERKVFDGELVNGLASGEWKFYYASGVVQIQGNYKAGYETGIWVNYFAQNKPRLVKEYSDSGFMLMRTEYYNNGRVKNYQNVACPEYGNMARRIQFTYDVTVEYMDIEKSYGKMPPKDLMDLIKKNGFRVQ